MREVIDKKLKDNLRLFLENVDIESLSLVKLALNVKESDTAEGVEVKADLSIRPKIEDDGKLSFLYNHKEKILVEGKEINIEISYKLLLEYKRNVKELKRSLLMAYAKNSGLLLVYPYIRHLSDIIKREAGFIFSPLPHILIK